MGADEYWDRVWAGGRAERTWREPDPWVAERVATVSADGGGRALDLGCGIGRHVLHMARRGLKPTGLDSSPAAIEQVRQAAEAEDLACELTVADFESLPFEDDEFDYVLAFNVVYHGTEASIARVLGEIRRVLRPRGIYQSTMLSKRNAEYGLGVETSPNSFRRPEADDDKVHDHLYADERDLLRLHEGFALLSAEDREHERPGSYHWHCVFEITEEPK